MSGGHSWGGGSRSRRYLDEGAIARKLCISERAARRHIEKGTWPIIWFTSPKGGRWYPRVPEAAIDDWVRSQTRRKAAEDGVPVEDPDDEDLDDEDLVVEPE